MILIIQLTCTGQLSTKQVSQKAGKINAENVTAPWWRNDTLHVQEYNRSHNWQIFKTLVESANF